MRVKKNTCQLSLYMSFPIFLTAKSVNQVVIPMLDLGFPSGNFLQVEVAIQYKINGIHKILRLILKPSLIPILQLVSGYRLLFALLQLRWYD